MHVLDPFLWQRKLMKPFSLSMFLHKIFNFVHSGVIFSFDLMKKPSSSIIKYCQAQWFQDFIGTRTFPFLPMISWKVFSLPLPNVFQSPELIDPPLKSYNALVMQKLGFFRHTKDTLKRLDR